MIVVDTSALISLAIADSLDTTLSEFDVHTTTTVVEELEETADFDDSHGQGAQTALSCIDEMNVHEVAAPGLQSSRIDRGEASCLALSKERAAEFLLTDDLRALPELQALTDAEVALSPIVLRALVTRDALTATEALNRLEQLASTRDWLGAPIYRRAQELFDDEK